MKNLILSIVICLFINSLYSQSVPQGMKYQAVARDLKGKVIANQQVSLKIELQSNDQLSEIFYSENHLLTTNQFGLFSLVIGEGIIEKGDFVEIPWNTQDIWIKIAIKLKGETYFTTISNSKLLTVPYAFHAGTANELTSKKGNGLYTKEGVGVPSQNWSLFGNSKSDPDKDKLGTTDNADLVFVTNNKERLRITANGEIMTGKGKFTIGGNLEVQGDKTNINKDLYVGRNVYLNVNDEFDPPGFTVNYGDFTVENNSFTKLTGDLEVAGNGQFDATLNTDGDFSISTDKFTINAETGNTHVDGTHYVKGESTFEGLTSFTTINVSDDVPDGNFLATFENTNNGTGDGIKIKLGKERATTIIPSEIPGLPTPAELEQIKNLIRCDFSGNKVTLLGDIVVDGLQADVEMIAGLTVSIGNLLIDFINAEIISQAYLPELAVPNIDFPTLFTPTINISPPSIPGVTIPSKQITAGITLLNFKLLGVDKSVKLPALNTPSLSTPSLAMPSFGIPKTQIIAGFNLIPRTVLLQRTKILPNIPNIDLSALGIDEIKIKDLDFWGIPNICLDDGGATPLNNKNEFIQFADNADKKMGSIRAVSVSDWSSNYLNPVFLFKLRGALTNAVDKKHAMYHFKAETTKALKDYASIGVEYSSGNGDYAEWLERENHHELISTGDIVAIKAGKITKNLHNAEQIMAVSHRPIVLGNAPEEGKVHLGNTIAFMGQIPVKVIGPVQAGDYIVAKSEILGYGVGVNPEEMSIEDFKFTVGRAWDTDVSTGPKMINTVVGIHNGDYINILKRYEQKFKQTEARVQSVEANLEILTDLVTKKTPSI